MWRPVCGTAVAGVFLSACSPVPSFKSDHRIKPEQVAARVQCELKLAAQQPSAKRLKLREYDAGYSLTLNVETTVNPSITGDWVIPYHLTDTFTAKPTAGITDYVLRESTINYTLSLDSLANYECPEYLAKAYREDSEAALIKYGSFGLIDWIDGLGAASTGAPAQSSIGQLKYTLKFAVTGTLDPSPGFKIVNLSGTLKLPYTRKDTHALNVVMTQSGRPPGVKRLAPAVPGADMQRLLNEQLNLMQLRDVLRDR